MANSDVKSAHLGASGWYSDVYPVRVRGVSTRGTASAGKLGMFSTSVAPTAGTYGQSGTTITVTSNGHGLITGDKIGIAYAKGTGGSASCGNAEVTVTDANTFTITCFNSFTITGNPACHFVKAPNYWLATFSVAANDTYNNYMDIPDNGLRSNNRVWGQMTNLDSSMIFYA